MSANRKYQDEYKPTPVIQFLIAMTEIFKEHKKRDGKISLRGGRFFNDSPDGIAYNSNEYKKMYEQKKLLTITYPKPIKILLDTLVEAAKKNQQLTDEERNKILLQITEEIRNELIKNKEARNPATKEWRLALRELREDDYSQLSDVSVIRAYVFSLLAPVISESSSAINLKKRGEKSITGISIKEFIRADRAKSKSSPPEFFITLSDEQIEHADFLKKEAMTLLKFSNLSSSQLYRQHGLSTPEDFPHPAKCGLTQEAIKALIENEFPTLRKQADHQAMLIFSFIVSPHVKHLQDIIKIKFSMVEQLLEKKANDPEQLSTLIQLIDIAMPPNRTHYYLGDKHIPRQVSDAYFVALDMVSKQLDENTVRQLAFQKLCLLAKDTLNLRLHLSGSEKKTAFPKDINDHLITIENVLLAAISRYHPTEPHTLSSIYKTLIDQLEKTLGDLQTKEKAYSRMGETSCNHLITLVTHMRTKYTDLFDKLEQGKLVQENKQDDSLSHQQPSKL